MRGGGGGHFQGNQYKQSGHTDASVVGRLAGRVCVRVVTGCLCARDAGLG